MQTLTIKITDNQNIDFLIDLLSKFNFVKEIKTKQKQVLVNAIENELPFL